MKLINSGAEGKIYETKNKTILKIREPEEYRNEELDLKLRKKRTKRELKILKLAHSNNIPCPKVLNEDITKSTIEMEKIIGIPISKILTKEILIKCLTIIGDLHKAKITHGDLTPLNFLYSKETNKVHIIDFGLADFSSHKEERAVDLNVFFTYIDNDHQEYSHLKEELLKTYSSKLDSNEAIEVLNQLKIVESRGRNKNKQ